MAEFKGTKGKWSTRNDYDQAYEQPVISIDVEESIESLVTIWSSSDDKTIPESAKYDALLISKAPEMLEMLNKAAEKLYSVENPSTSCRHLADEIIDLINQATELPLVD